MTFLISVTNTEVVKTVSSLLLWLGKPRRIMTFLFTVETGGMTQALTSRAGNVGGMVIGGWERTRVVSSPLVFQATLALFFLPSLLVGGLVILGT